MIAASELKARIALQAPADDGEWIDEGGAFARIEAVAGVGAAFDGAARETLYAATLRAPSPVDRGWRLIWGERRLRVLGVRQSSASPGFLDLDCAEERP